MIKSTYISNIEIASFDNLVTDILNALDENENGKVMNIGIKTRMEKSIEYLILRGLVIL